MVDQRRFEWAWQTYGAAILRYCRFASGCEMTGEDLATETFVRFLEAGDRLPDGKVEAWLYTVARNECRSHQRRRLRWTMFLPELHAQIDQQEDAYEMDDVTPFLDQLNERQRLAIYLRIVEDRTFSDVARVMKLSEPAARKLVERALNTLRRSMTEVQPGSSTTPKRGVERAR